jgi:hypothetical protein
LEEEKVNVAFPSAAIGKGLAGFGDKIEAASGEKKSIAGPLAPVAKETVLPLTIGTEGALGTRIPPSFSSVI